MKQFALGVEWGIGEDLYAFAINTPLLVPVPRDYTVKIAPSLEQQGVKFGARGVKFPARGVYHAALIIDSEFKEVEVRPATKKVVAASMAGMKFDGEKMMAGFKSFIEQIDPNGEIAKVIDIIFDDRIEVKLKALWNSLSGQLSKIDWDRFSEELKAIADRHSDKISPPDTD